ncbi:hypothetical protein C5615_00935 [Burkholderia cepacia]|uniref:Uncharacterized protein n=1 Tax=Burkholderia cepacia TaxID=292 RepID=A0A2S8J5C8_BURCE|nr:hypothetical protein C5615_00935 [Burkholderia cepacia]TDA45248.1 hypothetical protein EVG18_22905 [Burkholderia pyrrocinia]
MPEIARMAASFVACLARPNGAPHFLPYARFRAFACAFHTRTAPNQLNRPSTVWNSVDAVWITFAFAW